VLGSHPRPAAMSGCASASSAPQASSLDLLTRACSRAPGQGDGSVSHNSSYSHPGRDCHGPDGAPRLYTTHLCCRCGRCSGIVCAIAASSAAYCTSRARHLRLRAGPTCIGDVCGDGSFGRRCRCRLQGAACAVEVVLLGRFAAKVAHGWREKVWSWRMGAGRR
jgi:hypothetical protein